MRFDRMHARTPRVRSLAIATLVLMLAASPLAAQRRASARRAEADAPPPTTSAVITVGGARYAGRVDANCTLDEKATPTNTRFYYTVTYPWFGARAPAGQPQWRFSLNVARPATPEAFQHFVFSFLDGTKSATIQNVVNAQRMGSGTVRVTRHDAGARFDVQGRSKEGDVIQAAIDCASFPRSEGGGG
jgi:hypothetical protein